MGFLFHIKLQHLALFEPSFQMVVDVNGTYTHGRSGIKKVTGLQWGGHTVEELMDPIKKQIPGLSKVKKDELEDDGGSEMMEEE